MRKQICAPRRELCALINEKRPAVDLFFPVVVRHLSLSVKRSREKAC